MVVRIDDYLEKREHLSNFTDEELKDYFWKLAESIVEPLATIASQNTSPSIERSILMRMGFSSMEANELVKLVIEKSLIGKGAGHVVFIYATLYNLEIREAGLRIIASGDLDMVCNYFLLKNAKTRTTN